MVIMHKLIHAIMVIMPILFMVIMCYSVRVIKIVIKKKYIVQAVVVGTSVTLSVNPPSKERIENMARLL